MSMRYYLNLACTTFGHPGAAPTTNFIRQLYLTMISAGGELGPKYDEDLRGLAEIDAHSYNMATSIHYDLSDLVDGPLVNTSVKAFYHLNKRMPVGFPEERLTDEEFAALKSGMGKKGQKKRGVLSWLKLNTQGRNMQPGLRNMPKSGNMGQPGCITGKGTLSKTGCTSRSLRICGGMRAWIVHTCR